MHQILEKLHKDHMNLSRVLDLLSLQLDHFFAGRESDFDLKIELLEYIETYADQGHHPLEELIFGVAIRRMGEGNELLTRLVSQHGSLVMLTRKFRQSLEGVLHDGVMLRDELEVQGREFIALQRLHIDLEENDAFPLLESVMTERDWQEVSGNMPSHNDPVFEEPDKVRFQTVFEYLRSVG